MGIHRDDGSYVGVPRGETTIYPRDTLVLYGRGKPSIHWGTGQVTVMGKVPITRQWMSRTEKKPYRPDRKKYEQKRTNKNRSKG